MRLSERQTQIVKLVGRDGLEWETVCQTLKLAPSTVRAHVDRILVRTGNRRKPREAMTEIYWRHVAHTDDEAGGDA